MSLNDFPRSQRRFGRVPEAAAYAGISKTRLYAWAKRNKGLFRKNGYATIVDFNVLDQVLNELPVADLKSDES